jgi:hypothetical protein
MNLNNYLDDAVAAIQGNTWDGFVNTLKEEIGENISEGKFGRELSDLKDKAKFRNDFNTDDYINEAVKAKTSDDTWADFKKNMRRNILRGGYELSHYTDFLIRLDKAIGGLEEGEKPTDISSVQSAINSSFTIGGKPMTISDLENANDAIPSYSTKDYNTKLARLKGMLTFESKEAIPTGSIQILIDKFEAEKEEGEFKTLDAILPNINLKGFFTQSGLFSGTQSSERNEIYDYWETIARKFEGDFIPTIKKFVDEHDSIRSEWEKVMELSDPDDPKSEILRSYIVNTTHNNLVNRNVPDILNAVNIFIHQFLEIKLGIEIVHDKERIIAEEILDDEGRPTGKFKGDFDEQAAKDTKDDLDFIVDEGEDNPMLLDPILLINYDSGKLRTMFKKDDLISARRLLRNEGRRVRLDNKLLQVMEEYFDEFLDEIQEVERENYYLPISSEVHDRVLVDEIDEAYGNFFEKLTDIMLEERSQLPTSGTYTGTGKEDVQGVRETPTSAKIGSGKFKRKEYSNVLAAIHQFVIEPINSGKYFGTKPKFTTQKWFSELLLLAKNDPFTSVLETNLERMAIKAADLDNIADMFELQSRRADITARSTIKKEIMAGIKSLNKVIGENDHNEQLGGHILYLVTNGGEINGTSAEELHNEYLASPKKGIVYSMLEYLLNSYLFRKKLKIKELGGREKIASVPRTYQDIQDIRPSWVAENRKDLLVSAQRVFKVLDENKKSVMNSFGLIMEAHDAIRKMKNKEIVYGCLTLTDVDNVDYILKRVSKYDLNVLDLQQIVTDLDSFANIAKSFGINEESVYMIKGLCRGVY